MGFRPRPGRCHPSGQIINLPVLKNLLIGGALGSLLIAGCASSPEAHQPIAASAKQLAKEGFHPLFNGRDLSGWKLRRADGHPSWTVANGELINTVNTGEHGTDLVTDANYWNFNVHYEYKELK